MEDQYSGYVSVEDVHANGKLTLGENVADLGGEILAYMAWEDATKNKNLQPIDDLTPEQRFFIGFAQWDCANERPEDVRVRAMTDAHSPARYRINGVLVNMPEFAESFSCKPGQPMVKPAANVCRVVAGEVQGAKHPRKKLVELAKGGRVADSCRATPLDWSCGSAKIYGRAPPCGHALIIPAMLHG